MVWGYIAELLQKLESANQKSTTREIVHAPPSVSVDDLVSLGTEIITNLTSVGQLIDVIDSKTLLSNSVTGLVSAELVSTRASIAALELKIKMFENKDKPKVMTVGGMFLQSLSNANSWIQSNLAFKDVRLVVDNHTVLKHIYANVVGDDLLKNFKKM